jgi:hypothetical protein
MGAVRAEQAEPECDDPPCVGVGIVRPSRNYPGAWVVEPADGHNAGPTRRFSGHRAPEQAASFAHQSFTAVRCFLV